jgi:hypothetical protein
MAAPGRYQEPIAEEFNGEDRVTPRAFNKPLEVIYATLGGLILAQTDIGFWLDLCIFL